MRTLLTRAINAVFGRLENRGHLHVLWACGRCAQSSLVATTCERLVCEHCLEIVPGPAARVHRVSQEMVRAHRRRHGLRVVAGTVHQRPPGTSLVAQLAEARENSNRPWGGDAA